MTEIVRRGYNPKDEYEFGKEYYGTLKKAAEELMYLINRGYDIKSTSTFIGNHYMLSERQRLALTRMLSTREQLDIRKEKEIIVSDRDKEVIENKIKDITANKYYKYEFHNCLGSSHNVAYLHIDGFNTIITLEVALSNSLILKGLDGTYRDLAGLRGNYRIVDKTIIAIEMLFQTLAELDIYEVTFYLDKPVSNSGRLKVLLYDLSQSYPIQVNVDVLNDVDRVLEEKDMVVTSDGVILDRCKSWFNLNQHIIKKIEPRPWIFTLI